MDYGIPQIQRSVNWLNVLTLGGDYSGGSDISQYILAAAKTSRVVYLPEGRFLISNSITLPDDTVIIGAGRRKTFIVLKSNISAFVCGNKCQFKDLEFVGTYGSGGNTSQIGISINTKYGCSVENCGFSFISGYAVYITLTAAITSPTNGWTYGNKVIGCFGETNQGGVFLDARAEYNTVANNSFNDGVYGVRCAGGNNIIVGNNFTIDTYGLYLEGGTNNGHGIADGNIANHCGTANLYCTGLTLGYQISNNQFYAGNIQILNCTGNVSITGGEIGATTITVTSSPNVLINPNAFVVNPTFSITGTAPLVRVNANGYYVAKTSNYSLTYTDANTPFTNTGASGAVNFTLPTAFAGLEYDFYIDAAQTFTITAGASTSIRIAGSNSAAAGNISASTIGNSVKLKAISATQWVAMSHEGTWTVT